jgi:hypothetical protein
MNPIIETIEGATCYQNLFTDGDGRTWHVTKREGGTVSLYYTVPGIGVHSVMWDSADGDSSLSFYASKAIETLSLITEAFTVVNFARFALQRVGPQLTNDQKAALYYKSGSLTQPPPYVPSRVRVLKATFGDPPFRGAGVAAGEHDCRSNRLGAVSVIDRAGQELGLRLNEFEVLAWRENVEPGADVAGWSAKGAEVKCKD